MEATKEQKVLQQVINQAWENEAYKQELITNPVKAIEELTGAKMQLQGKRLVVRDQSDPNTVYINIPFIDEADVELSEYELEKVAGGCQVGDTMSTKIIKIKRPSDYIKLIQAIT